MIGEGYVDYRGTRMSAEQALSQSGLRKNRLGPKDALVIVSSNVLAAGKAALLADHTEKLVNTTDLI